MPRGGKRPGAGRKRILTDLERLSVGAECEALSAGVIEKRLQDQIDELKQVLEDEFKAAENIQLEDRNKLGQEERDLMAYDVDAALSGHLELGDNEKPSRFFQFSSKRPKGQRQAIIKKVADARALTCSMVDNCWKEYRRMKSEND